MRCPNLTRVGDVGVVRCVLEADHYDRHQIFFIQEAFKAPRRTLMDRFDHAAPALAKLLALIVFLAALALMFFPGGPGPGYQLILIAGVAFALTLV